MIHLVIYKHKHGDDISCHSNADVALRHAAQIIVDNLDLNEFKNRGTYLEIAKAINDGNFDTAMDLWGNHQYGSTSRNESIEIHEMKIHSFTEGPEVRCERCDRVLASFMKDVDGNLSEVFGCPDCDS